jgi:aspartate ammonia-lyase
MIGIGTETAIPAGCHGADIMPQRIGPDGFSEVINEISIQVFVNDPSDIIFTKYLWIHHDSSARS